MRNATSFLNKYFAEANLKGVNAHLFNWYLGIIFVSISFPCFTQITRTQIISNAVPYTTFTWTATSSNIWNGVSCGGKTIQTPSWVKIGSNTGMPYCWGGWTSTSSIQGYLNSGKSAGDNNTATSFGVEPSCAVGLDCSGLVSRAWGLTSKYSTSTLPNISTSKAITQTQPGDILNLAGSHTRLIETNYGNGNYRVIESSATDWKTSYRTYTTANLSSYTPRSYNNVSNGTQTGYASVSQGISITPTTVISESDFTTSFTLKETKGASITFESIVCAILKSDNTFLRDMEIKGPITIVANGTYTYSSTLQWLSTAPAGSYSAVARGKVAGADWFDFSVNGGTSPKGFQVNQIPTPGAFTLTVTPECNGTTSQIRLNWTASTNAASYDVFRDGSIYSAGTGITDTKFINSGNITVGTSYNYYVRAKNAGGTINSNVKSATAPNCNPIITITSPIGGENWQAGSTQTITWTSTGVSGNVLIQPYIGSSPLTNIAASAPNTGSYSWTIPSNYASASTYKIGISAMSGTVSDFSSYFTVSAPAQTCTSPTATVNNCSGTSPLTMTCSTTGGSGGNYAYKWYSGTSCSGTVIGTNSTLNVTSRGYYSCKVYISGFESTCYSCSYGYATINSPQETTMCSWNYRSDMPAVLYGSSSVSYDNFIYIFGGNTSKSFYKYDAINDKFTTMSALPSGHDEGDAALIGNKIYLIHNASDEKIRVYDIISGSWTTKSSRPIGTYGRYPVFIAVNNYLYAIGGCDDNLIPSNQLDRYDPVNDTWTTINNPMPTARLAASSVVYNNMIYVIGGRTSSSILNLVEVYDPIADSWTTKASMPAKRSGAVAELVNNKIYVIGGFTGSKSSNSIYVYDIKADSWSTISLSPSFINCMNSVSSVVNNKMYVIGGDDLSNSLASTEELNFCPITGIENIDNDSTIKIYPNPTTGKLEISGVEALGNKLKVDVIDFQGKIVYSSGFNNVGYKIGLDLSTYPKGLYLIRLSNDVAVYNKKLIKE